jgi:hypothetical protein
MNASVSKASGPSAPLSSTAEKQDSGFGIQDSDPAIQGWKLRSGGTRMVSSQWEMVNCRGGKAGLSIPAP